MHKRKKEKIDMRGGMIELPNIEKTKWNDYQPQISKKTYLKVVKNFEFWNYGISKIKQSDKIHGE